MKQSVDGYTSDNPVLDEDWADVVRWEVDLKWVGHRDHDLNGFIAEFAGSDECVALGHVADVYGGWDAQTHPYGWGNEQMCVATRYGTACTYCESEDCEAPKTDTSVFWKLFEEKNV